MPRALAELVEQHEPGIALVRSWIAQAKHPVEPLQVDRAAGEQALVALQITSRSPMGALALETGGVLVDHGWVRVLGGGSSRLPRSIPSWNGMAEGRPRMPGALIVGDDVVGGVFAVNGGALDDAPGSVHYLAPDTLAWEPIAASYSEWLVKMLTADLAKFYEGWRWPGWERDVTDLPGDRGYLLYPFPSTTGPAFAERHRGAVPLEELWGLFVGDTAG
jgi:hypothetical protein